MTETRTQLSPDSWIDLYYLPEELSIDFTELWNLHPAEQEEFFCFGRKTLFPRFHQSFCVPYKFSGKTHEPLHLPDSLVQIKNYFDEKYEKFDQVLVNWYVDGNHYISAHKDDESQIVKNSPIASISLGATRIFRIRNNDKKIVKDISMSDRCVLIMGGKFQTEFTHEVPKINGEKGKNTGKRINITLRKFK